jgi:hypothetical protein
MLMITSTTWGQSTVANVATTTTSQPATDFHQAIKQEIRSTLVQVFVDKIHNLFSDLRIFAGLPDVPTDPTTDPLVILESIVVQAINDSVGQ